MDIMALAAAIRRGELVIENPSPMSHAYHYKKYPRWLYKHGEEARLVVDEYEERTLGTLWADSPQGAKDAKDRLDALIAQAAAAREYDDRHLGPKARAELTAYQQDADDHVLDVPARKDH